jgi:NADH-quinone oxidoreductase B subunit
MFWSKWRVRMIVERIIRWARRRSPWVLHFNSGGCNGCDIEFVDLLTPRYDIERLGMLKEASPRHADILMCTGPVTRQSRDRLLRIYEQIPEPKWVVAVGACACSGGIFAEGYNVLGGIERVLPVSMYVPGCPCRPEAMIDALVRLLESI